MAHRHRTPPRFPIPPALRELHEAVRLDSFEAAMEWVRLVARRTRHGDAVLTFLDDDRRPVELFVISEGATVLPWLLSLSCRTDQPEVSGLLLVTDRTGELPADRPDDELVWQELVAIADAGATTLYDWFVVCEQRWAFSVAEFAPTPARW